MTTPQIRGASARDVTPDNDPLTDEQAENWRIVLTALLGPYALLMTREEIQVYRNRMQKLADAESKADHE